MSTHATLKKQNLFLNYPCDFIEDNGEEVSTFFTSLMPRQKKPEYVQLESKMGDAEMTVAEARAQAA